MQSPPDWLLVTGLSMLSCNDLLSPSPPYILLQALPCPKPCPQPSVRQG